jgi:DUF1680 family protein
VAKWIEAASYCLATTEDPELEAGVAHFETTGKTALLDVVRRYADLRRHP